MAEKMTTSRVTARMGWSNQVGIAEQEVIPANIESGLSRASSRSEEVWFAQARVEPIRFQGIWTETLWSRLADLSSLSSGWDSYDAPPLNREAVGLMIATLAQLDHNVRSAPKVLPTSQGGLLCMWTSGAYSLQLTSSEDGEINVYFSVDSGEEWEGPIERADDINKWLWQATAPSV
jgi:hypothetical protein